MRQFRLVQPDDAEVLRDSRWVRYDPCSLVVGDVIRLAGGDVVPADCVVLSLGMGGVDDSRVVPDFDDDDGGGGVDGETGWGGGGGGCGDDDDDDDEVTVDARLVTGGTRPDVVRRRRGGDGAVSHPANSNATLFYGSRVLSGACVAVVVSTGENVALSRLMRAGRWPPVTDMSEEVARGMMMMMANNMETNDDDEEGGTGMIALVPMS
jgi:magnesium-transporting ATPase (P-type)